MLPYLPAMLCGALLGAQAFVLVCVTAFIVAWACRIRDEPPPPPNHRPDPVTGLMQEVEATRAVERFLAQSRDTGQRTACFVVGLDAPDQLIARTTTAEFDAVLCKIAARLATVLRDHDVIARLEGPCFLVALCSGPRADLESLIQIALRLQTTLHLPVSVGDRDIFISVHVGFCQRSRAPDTDASGFVAAARTAAKAARDQGRASIRAFTPDMGTPQAGPAAGPTQGLDSEIGWALDAGTLRGFFEPEFIAATGVFCGMRLRPRWLHATHGLLTEKEILPAITHTGLSVALDDLMRQYALQAVSRWGATPSYRPVIGLPVSLPSLQDARYADKLELELERFNLSGANLRLLLPEAIVATQPAEDVLRSLARCHGMGIAIELAGFGTTSCTLPLLRRLNIQCIWIAPDLVTRCDHDTGHQGLIAGTTALAARLGLKVGATGVSALGEHAQLVQLGCDYVQGPSLAPILSQDDLPGWLARHHAKATAMTPHSAPKALKRFNAQRVSLPP